MEVTLLVDTNIKDKLDPIFSRYEGKKDDLIPLLQDVHEEFGYLPKDAMLEISRFLRIPDSNVYGVATFYALFKLAPSGRKIVRCCRGTACHVKGGARILNEIQQSLNIKPGETTPDMEYGLETVACIGACALAPVITVAGEVHGQMTPKKVAEVFGDKYRAK
jgi:NADH:ubiquinone oxidoreductase subunit E